MAEVKPSFEELPLDARARIAHAAEVLPELRDTFVRLYPTPEQERRHRDRMRSLGQQRAESRRLEREARARSVLAGAFGVRARSAAESALRQCGDELTTEAVELILGIVRGDEEKKGK